MHIVAKFSVSLTVAFVLSACTTIGNKNLDNVGSYISLRENESTKANVYEVFGQPHDVRPSTADETVWVYYRIYSRPSAWTYVPFVGMVAGGAARDMTFAYFSFDTAGTLQKIMTRSDNDYENTWAGLGRAVARHSDKTPAQRVEDEMKASGFEFDPKIAKSVQAVRDE